MMWIALLYMPHAMMSVPNLTERDCRRVLAAHKSMWGGGNNGLDVKCIQVRAHASRVGDRRGEDGVSPHTKQAGTGAG